MLAFEEAGQCQDLGLSLPFAYAAPSMELRQLRYFVAVAEEGNISRAAQKIFLTQPALSRQIKALENEIGQCLLERSAHSIRLSPAGEALLPEARRLLQEADQMLERARAGDGVARLRIGYAPSLAAGVLPAAMESFRQAHPKTRVELFDLSTAEMLSRLQNGKLDAALTVGEDHKSRGIEWTPLVRAPWKLALPPQHRWAGRTRVTAEDIAGESILAYSREEYPEYWEIVSHWLRGQRARSRMAGEYDGAESLMAAVEAGLGVALVTARTAHRFPGRVRYLSIVSPPAPLCIAAGYQAARAHDPLLAAFVEQMRLAAGKFA